MSAALAENRSRDTIAGRNTELAAGAGNHFEDGTDRAHGRDQIVGHRLGIFGDVHDAAVGGDEYHVERDIGVVHPELDLLLGLEIKQHAVALGQFLAKHQAERAVGRIGRKLHRDCMHARSRHDIDRVLPGCASRRQCDGENRATSVKKYRHPAALTLQFVGRKAAQRC